MATVRQPFLWMALRFPYLPFEINGVDVDREPVLLVGRHNNVFAASKPCIQEGVRVGMPVSTAQLILDCAVQTRDESKELLALNNLSEDLYQLTPYIKQYEKGNEYSENGLLLEFSRSLKLFGGKDVFEEKVLSLLASSGYRFLYATANTEQAAWLLSFRPEGTSCSEDSLFALPLDLLETFPGEVESLKNSGFLTFLDLARQVKKAGWFVLQKRFGERFIDYLKNVFNANNSSQSTQNDLFTQNVFSNALSVFEPDEIYSDLIYFDYPVSSIEQLHEPMRLLLERLGEHLVKNQQQCLSIQWGFSDIYLNQRYLTVCCESVYRDWSLLYELTLINLEQQGLPFEVDQLELRQPQLTPLNILDQKLNLEGNTGQCTNTKARQITLSRLSARLGDHNVYKIGYQDDHFPELSHKKLTISSTSNENLSHQHRNSPRPSWILNTPITIGVHQNDLFWNGRIHLLRGPERIEGHWWNKATARDYFIAVRDDHSRLWVFHDLFKQEWFVQGVF